MPDREVGHDDETIRYALCGDCGAIRVVDLCETCRPHIGREVLEELCRISARNSRVGSPHR